MENKEVKEEFKEEVKETVEKKTEDNKIKKGIKMTLIRLE